MTTEILPQVDAAEVYSGLDRIEATQTGLLYWVPGLGGTTLVTMIAILISILLGSQS